MLKNYKPLKLYSAKVVETRTIYYVLAKNKIHVKQLLKEYDEYDKKLTDNAINSADIVEHLSPGIVTTANLPKMYLSEEDWYK